MLAIEHKQSFDSNGYLVVKNALPGEVLVEIQEEARKLAQTDLDKPNRVWHERALFRRVLDAPRLIEVAADLLGGDVQLLELDLLLTRAAQGGIGWHRDVSFICNKTLSINTGLYLQDLSAAASPLRVVPGSHHWEESPGSGPHDGEIALYPRASDAVFFDAGLWHSGSANRSNGCQDKAVLGRRQLTSSTTRRCIRLPTAPFVPHFASRQRLSLCVGPHRFTLARRPTMRWYEWPLLWLAFFVPCTILVPAFSQVGGPLRGLPDQQQRAILILVPLCLTLLVGLINTRLRSRQRH